MAFTVVFDANVLHPAPLRDLLIRLARAGIFRAKWTDAILDECFRSIRADRPDLDPKRLERTRELITKAVPDCLVMAYESLIDGLNLPDPDDRHVLAAAIRAGAQVIVTRNLKDFPKATLSPYGIEAQDPEWLQARLRHTLAIGTSVSDSISLESELDLLQKLAPLYERHVLKKGGDQTRAASLPTVRFDVTETPV